MVCISLRSINETNVHRYAKIYFAKQLPLKGLFRKGVYL